MFRALAQAVSLIEVALLHLLISSLIIGFSVFESGLNRKQKVLDTESEIQVVNNHLMAFWLKNKYLPCPAYLEKDIYNELGFEEARYFNECSSYFGVKESYSEEYYVGAIPIKDLNLGLDFQSDQFNSKYFYIVRKSLVSLDNNFISKAFVEHHAKSIIWFAAEFENVSNSQWLIEAGSKMKILNANSDFKYQETNGIKEVSGSNLFFSLFEPYDYLFFDLNLQHGEEINFVIDDVKIELTYIGGECKFDIFVGFEVYDSVSSNCSVNNRIGFEYDLENNSFILIVNFVNILGIPISFVEAKMSVVAQDSFKIKNLIFFRKENSSIVNDYFNQPNLPNFADVVISHNDNLKSPDFLVMSNLSNKLFSYNLNGKLLIKGEMEEEVFEINDGFIVDELSFDCPDISVACSVYNNSSDYSILFGRIF
ncbi:hypothetical protein OAP83_02020 [Rickettsiales bacterium]|nr:hypothetical protein [Rickettsiales bacterium]